MPMLMLLALTVMLIQMIFYVDAYDAADAANVDANMPNVACHLVRAYASVVAASVAAGS